MEIKIGTGQMLKILNIISWIIFIGLCIEAGIFIVNTFFALFINPKNASYLDLSGLYNYDRGYFFVEMLLVSIVAILKAYLFYVIVKILGDKKLNMSEPFSGEMGRFIYKLSYLSLGIGLFCWWGVKFSEWFIKSGVVMPDIRKLSIGGADVWLFMGVTVFVIAEIFKRGIEIQTENELTI